jgi:3' exoribonuclease, RNase T-like
MRFFLDTEFIESGPSFPLISLSIAIVAEDGRELYIVNADAPLELANAWVKKNVIPNLGDPRPEAGDARQPILKLSEIVRRFIGESKPEFWGYYADYDWVVFCQLFGTMIDLPKGWPMYCRDLKQFCDDLGNPELPKQNSTEHNALHDARWNREAWNFLNHLRSRKPSLKCDERLVC